MPLYMDIHTVDSDDFSVEDVVKAHMQDLAIQAKFGVTQIKYWVNVDAKTLFCLMEGPNKEACNQVHVESHGNTACNIIEVKDDEYNLFMGNGTSVNDLAHTDSGNVDTGYRTLIMLTILDINGKNQNYSDELNRIIKENNGSLILSLDETMISFILAADAISCAKEIGKFLETVKSKIEFTISVVSGRPVDEKGNDLFEETKKKVIYLSSIGHNKDIYIDNETVLLAEKSNKSITNTEKLTFVSYSDIEFLLNLFNILNQKLCVENFTSDELPTLLGLSKSQVYRKIKSLTSIAPNQLIQELRMRKSLKILKKKDRTIAETAFDLGFNSPTYFTKVFRSRFGITPSEFSNMSFS